MGNDNSDFKSIIHDKKEPELIYFEEIVRPSTAFTNFNHLSSDNLANSFKKKSNQ